MKLSPYLLIIFMIFSTLIFAQTDTIRVACVGNSITVGHGLKDSNLDSYPSQLGMLLGDDYDVRNFGVSGYTMLKKGDRPYWNTAQFQ